MIRDGFMVLMVNRSDELVHPPQVAALDWTDATKSPPDRPEIWHNLLHNPTSPRTIIAADVVCQREI